MTKELAKPHLKQLITNDDGSLSRTQCILLTAFVVTITLLGLHVFWKELLSWQVMSVLGFIHVFALLDRVDARHIHVQASKDSLHIELTGDDK
jgi:hypothetical protein